MRLIISKLEMHARVRLSPLSRPDNAETLKLAYKYHHFLLEREGNVPGAVFLVVFVFFFSSSFWSSEIQLFCKYSDFNEVILFLVDFFCHQRLNLQVRLKMKKPHH